VRVLEFGAINLDTGAGVAEKRLGKGFDYAGLTGSGGAEEKQVSDGATGGVEAGQEHLVNLDDLFDGGVLTDDLTAESSFKVPGVGAPEAGV
jgi:hypothetical protein